MRNRREEINYHNRKFKYNLAGVAPNGEFTFPLDPPNETAFSNRYSQCLIKIKHAYLSNREDTFNHGLDPVFTNDAGVIELCGAGILLETDIKTNNSTFLDGTVLLGGGINRKGINCVLHSREGACGFAGNFGAVAGIGGATEVIVGKAAGGAGLQGANATTHNVSMWVYNDDRPIEDAGVICPNPFGRNVMIRMINCIDGQQVKLESANNLGGAASNGSSLNLELEILMLPNPTPEDP